MSVITKFASMICVCYNQVLPYIFYKIHDLFLFEIKRKNISVCFLLSFIDIS